MKRITVSSLLLCFVLTGSLYAQFDGQNGQASFYSEVEEENRPDFLQMEEEAMLIERWESSLSTLGLQNVNVLQEVQLQELEQDIQRERAQLQQEVQQIVSYIDQLQNRNEQLQQLHNSLAAMLVDLSQESELYAAMDQTDEAEQQLLSDNESEMNTIALELQNYQSELARNDENLMQQQDALMLSESLLENAVEQEEAIIFLSSRLPLLQEYRQMAMARTVNP